MADSMSLSRKGSLGLSLLSNWAKELASSLALSSGMHAFHAVYRQCHHTIISMAVRCAFEHFLLPPCVKLLVAFPSHWGKLLDYPSFMVFGTGEIEGIEKQWRKSLVGSLPVSVCR